MADTAHIYIVASPQVYTNARDSGEIQQLRDQFIGNYKGLLELQRILSLRELELTELVKQQQRKPLEGN